MSSHAISVFLGALLLTTQALATTTSEVFSKYPNKVFVETGSYNGDGIQEALKAGFERIYSIDLSPTWYQYCVERFKNDPRVTLVFGDSGSRLYEVIKDINCPITFWFDAHNFGVYTITAQGTKSNIPILRELEHLKHHPIKTHTILIDDLRCFSTRTFDFISLNKVIEKVKEINSKYQITYEDGYIPKDILVATVPKAKASGTAKKGKKR